MGPKWHEIYFLNEGSDFRSKEVDFWSKQKPFAIKNNAEGKEVGELKPTRSPRSFKLVAKLTIIETSKGGASQLVKTFDK